MVTTNCEYEETLPAKTKYLTSVAMFLECIVFGCAFNFFPPVLMDLKKKYFSDVDSISRIYVFMNVSYLGGAVAAGILFNRVIKRQHGVVLSFCGIAASLFISPFCSTMTQLFSSAVVLGFCCGAYDTATTVWMMEMHQSECGPFIQAQHCCYALGTFVPPLLTAPFLPDDISGQTNDNQTLNATNITDSPTEYFENVQEHSSIKIPFLIVSGLAVLNVLYELFLICYYPYKAPNRKSLPEKEKLKSEVELEEAKCASTAAVKDRREGGKCYKITIIALAGIFLGFYSGMELCSIQFIPLLAQVGDLKLSEANAALILGGLTGTFALGRFLGIFLTLKISSHVILCANVVLVLIGNIALLCWANSYLSMLWFGAIVLGCGFSTMYASFCTFVERHIVFDDFVGGIMLLSGSLVAIIYPVIVGRFLETNPLVLTFTNFFSVAVCCASLLIVFVITRTSSRKC